MSGHNILIGVPIVMKVIDNNTIFFSMLISAYSSKKFRWFSREHRAINEADVSLIVHASFEKIGLMFLEGL